MNLQEQRGLCKRGTMPFAEVEPGGRAVNMASNGVFVLSPH
jgi:hypothetical protein